jgi:hypothetical protein
LMVCNSSPMTRYVFHGHAGVELISQELNTFLEELDSKMKEEEA